MEHKRKKITPVGVLLFALKLLIIAIFVFPFLWMFSISLQTQTETLKMPPTFIPAVPQFQNYLAA